MNFIDEKYKFYVIAYLLAFMLLVAIIAVCYTDKANNTDRIEYNGRVYIKSSKSVETTDLSSFTSEVKPIGKFVKDMEVHDIENNPYASTVIFLKSKDGKYLAYELSGGP